MTKVVVITKHSCVIRRRTDVRRVTLRPVTKVRDSIRGLVSRTVIEPKTMRLTMVILRFTTH